MREKRRVSPVRRYWWLGPVVLGVIFIGWLATGPEWTQPRHGATTDHSLPPGYVSAFATVAQEYLGYTGKPLQDKDLAGQFEEASRLMSEHAYGNAAETLEAIAKKAAVPAVFNDLGLAYLALNDREHATNAFREVLSRDIDYQQVRQNMDRLREIGIDDAAPLTHEMEDNNSLLSPNLIAPGRPVESEIMAAVNDLDCFKVTTPRAPRDAIRISVTPRSRSLQPMMKIYDGEKRLIEWVKGKDAPGQAISYTIAPAPNTSLLLEIAGYGDSAGLYTVEATPLKSFDSYEPNDDILNARAIQPGQTVEANIMDGDDTDYYSFEAPRAGRVKVTVTNRSQTLIPALATFTPDMRSKGFGPDVRTPGGNLEHGFEVEGLKRYFVQVRGQRNTAGAYQLKVEM